MYDQEIDRDRATPSNQRLQTMVGRHIDQMIRTRNFKARNERFQTGVSVNSHKGRKVSVDRKIRECFQWKATGQSARGDSCRFSHGSNRGQRAQSSSLAPEARTQIDGRKPKKRALLGDKAESCAQTSSKESARIRRVIVGILPYVKNYKSDSGCKFGDQCLIRHTEAGGQPSKKSKKSGGKDQLPH